MVCVCVCRGGSTAGPDKLLGRLFCNVLYKTEQDEHKDIRGKKGILSVYRNVGKILGIVNKIVDNDRDLVYKIHSNV